MEAAVACGRHRSQRSFALPQYHKQKSIRPISKSSHLFATIMSAIVIMKLVSHFAVVRIISFSSLHLKQGAGGKGRQHMPRAVRVA
ncbi:hypothetical protein E2C01_032092 [Portunus trituberculatus]|uniref:Uncharacterized protein n=1 Tax=Portunus trituberculatus TaxID=210409 RepID=A0A5B7EV50_PORTR|nr:hypothetical protein [Portunus trituberculatus]